MPIISKTVIKKWSPRNVKYFSEKGYKYTKINDLFEVDIKDLKKTDRILVDIKCDFCGKIVQRQFNYCIDEEIVTCGNSQCAQKKSEHTVMKRYGRKHVFQVESVKNKIKETNIERYGETSYTKTQEYKERHEKTCMEIYGAPHSLCKGTTSYLKARQTLKNKYGSADLMTLPEFKEKRKKTWKDNWGCSNPGSSPIVKEKIKQTNIERRGCANPFSSPQVQEKIKQTNIERYGDECPMRNKTIRGKAMKTMKHNSSRIAASKDQILICNLLNGELNYKEKVEKRRFYLDIAFPEEKYYIEVDSPGHFVYLKMRGYNEEEGFQIDKKRDDLIHKLGYKNIRLISRKKNLNELFKTNFNKIFLFLINKLRNLLKEHERILCDFDNKIIILEPENKTLDLNIEGEN